MNATQNRDRRGADVSAALLKRCRAGSRAALAELLQPFDHEVLNMAYRLLGDTDDAHDIRQQAYLRVCRSIDGFDSRSAFRTWLLRIVVNLCRDHLRRSGAQRRRTDGWTDRQRSRPNTDRPESQCAAREQSQHVADAVQILPAAQREVLVLRHYHDMTLTQVAALLEIPLSTASSRLSAGLARLAALLDSNDEQRPSYACTEQE